MAVVTLKCGYCNKQYVVKFKRRKSKFCSNECRYKNQIGKKHSDECKKKISIAMTGENNPSRRPEVKRKISLACGGNGTTKRPYRKSDLKYLKVIREQIRIRDKRICQICNVTESMYKLSVHHIDYDDTNHKENNLITLCASCHTKTRFNRKYWEKRLKAMVK